MLLNNERDVYHFVKILLLKNSWSSELEEIISFKDSVHEGSFPAKIISCRLKSEDTITLRLKYSDDEIFKDVERKGIEYESKIYSYILRKTDLSVAPYYGYISENDFEALTIGYLEDAITIKHAPPNAFGAAAEWIADFHNYFQDRDFSFLKKRNLEYFQDWIIKVETLVNGSNELKWFKQLCECYRENLPLLLSGPQTIIHGEYYGKNILIQNNIIYPLDWEASAFGPAEVDLAALMDGKDSIRIQLATDSYIAKRYPNGLPENFEMKLILAELYFKFRWIVEWVKDKNELKEWLTNKEYSDRLREIATKLNCN